MWLLGATPSAQCAPVQPPPQGRAAKLMRADEPACCKRRNLALIRIYISAMDMRSVVVLALCGVCSAYQATTARTGALANQVTMMAKSKARPPAAAHTRSAEPRFASPATLLLTQRGTGPQVAPMFDAPDGLKGYVGEEDGFDPLRLSSAFDMVCRPPPCVRLSEM
jgi:hypothetical protein